MKTIARIALGVLALSVGLSAGEKKLMHCFYFTPAKDVTDADWQAFYKATDALPQQVSGVTRVWYGKLLRPQRVYSTDRDTNQKLAAGEEKVTGPVSSSVRQYGACFEFADEAALKKYANDPAHKKWEEVYFKVREYGTTTFDLLGQ